jgi:hypothetical protein
MARKSVQGDAFVPEEFRPQVPRVGRVYGVEFTAAEQQTVWKAIAEATGCSRMDVVRSLLNSAMEQCGRRHGIPYCHTYVDDAIVFMCEELGIDITQFPHNTPKLSVKAFVARAKREFVLLPLPRNEMQWSIQRRKWIDLWFGWVEEQCEHRGCEAHSHHSCEDLYGRPDFWLIATAIEADRSKKAKLIASIDAKPRGKAVKATEDALARIMIAGRGEGAST